MSFNLPLGPTPAAATSSSPISDSASFVPANDNVLDSEFNSSDVGVEAEEKREASPDAPASTSTSSPTPEARPMAEALLARCTSLLEEIEAFQHGLRRNNLEKSIQLRPFLNQVRSEHRCLQAVCKPYQINQSIPRFLNGQLVGFLQERGIARGKETEKKEEGGEKQEKRLNNDRLGVKELRPSPSSGLLNR